MRIIGSRSCLFVAGVILVAGAAFAQATSPAPNEPGAKPTAPDQNLSKELNQSNGVGRAWRRSLNRRISPIETWARCALVSLHNNRRVAKSIVGRQTAWAV
jgi:hypothetical protein